MEPFMLKYFKEDIQVSFPLAHIDIAEGFNGIESLITEGQYNVIFLDALLHNWPEHPVFKTYGGNIIPFIKEHSSKTWIISISSDKSLNEKMIEEGANGSVNKIFITKKKEINENLTIKE
jgi:hypothetical protein